MRRKNGNFFQIFIFGSQCIAINLERRLNFFYFTSGLYSLRNTDTRPAHSCVYLTCKLDWFQVLWFFWVPDQREFLKAGKSDIRTGLGTSVLQILEPKTGHTWTTQESLMLTPTLLFVLVFYSTRYELLQFSFIFAVFFLSGEYYFFNIISCRFYFTFRWPLFFFSLGVVRQTYICNIQSWAICR